MSGISFRNHRLAALDFGDLKSRQGDVKRGTIIGYLTWEPENGEGEVVLDRDFGNYNMVSALDMMDDWIGLLQREYETARSKGYEPQ